MAILWIPDIHRPTANLLRRDIFRVPGQFLGISPPAGAKYLRAPGLGCGGSGDAWGGAGCFVRSKRVTNPAWTYSVQVGDTATSSSSGDSAVWKGSPGTGEVIIYADRGRGDGTGGKAANSIGDVKRDGENGRPDLGRGGLPAGDAADFASLGFIGRAGSTTSSGDIGGGGKALPVYDDLSNFLGYSGRALGGLGRVALEWWDADPGY